MKPLAKRVTELNSSGLRKMFELAKNLKDPLDLSLGMSDFPLPDEVKNKIIEYVKTGDSGYTGNKGDLEVRQAIVKKLAKKNNIQTNVEEIIITSGVTGGIVLALSCLLDPGDEIMVLDPYFVMYQQIIYFLGAQPIYLDTYPNWEIPWEEMEKRVSPKTKAILFDSPRNPNGQVYGRADLEKLAAFAKKHDLVVISDEVYEEFIYEGEQISIGSIYQPTITLMGPSKSAALAGWRIGYLQGPQDLIEQMVKAQQTYYVCAPHPAQIALGASLDLDYTEMKKDYTEKNKMVKEILGNYPGLKGSFYAFLPAPSGDADDMVEKLIKENVLVVPGKVFSQKNTHFRISYSIPNEKLKKALEIIKKYL